MKSYVASCDPSATTDGNTRWSIKPAFLLETTTAAWDGFSASSRGQRQLLPMLPSIKICSDFRRIHLGFQPGRLKLNPFPFPSPADGLNKGYLLDPFGRFTRKWNILGVSSRNATFQLWASCTNDRLVNLDRSRTSGRSFPSAVHFPLNNMHKFLPKGSIPNQDRVLPNSPKCDSHFRKRIVGSFDGTPLRIKIPRPWHSHQNT